MSKFSDSQIVEIEKFLDRIVQALDKDPFLYATRYGQTLVTVKNLYGTISMTLKVDEFDSIKPEKRDRATEDSFLKQYGVK